MSPRELFRLFLTSFNAFGICHESDELNHSCKLELLFEASPSSLAKDIVYLIRIDAILLELLSNLLMNTSKKH